MQKRLDLDIVLKRIDEKCKEKNYDFLGFCDKEGNECEWHGTQGTYLKLHCNICGNIWSNLTYGNFIYNNQGCNKCAGKGLTEEEHIQKVLNKCKEKNYDFLGFCKKDGTNSRYIGAHQTYLKLHCNKCENNWNSTNYISFVSNDRGCPKCANQGILTNEYINRIKSKCNKIGYLFLGFCDKNGNECEWYGNRTHLKLHCNKCDKTWHSTNYCNFINGNINGCPKCSGRNLTNEERIDLIKERCKEKNYDFLGFCDKNSNNINYIGAKETFLKLHCNKCGNIWDTTSYDSFINNNVGCPTCNSSKLEAEIDNFLNSAAIAFKRQYHFKWLKNGKGLQTLDFYLPQYNCAIECQGIQHFEDGHFRESLDIIQERDSRKRRLCEENGVKLLYYSNLGIEYPYEVFEDMDKLLEEIKKI